jgi:hypothetical protein
MFELYRGVPLRSGLVEVSDTHQVREAHDTVTG